MSEKNIESKSIVPPQSLLCLRCGHEWSSFLKRPVQCPSCKQYEWDRKAKQRGRPRKTGGN